MWTCHLHYYEALVVTSVMCIEKEWVLKRMYNFEGRIARCDRYYILRDISRAALFTISRIVSCTATDKWTDMSPMGHGLRDSGCVSLGKTCIIILDIAFHCIAHSYHYWTWYCVLVILWLLNTELVIDDI